MSIVLLAIGVLAAVGPSRGDNICQKEMFGQDYILPMFISCKKEQHPNGSMVQTVPKLIPASSAEDGCPSRNNSLGIPPGYRVCRFPDCYPGLCVYGWCKETMSSYRCECWSGYRGYQCKEGTNSILFINDTVTTDIVAETTLTVTADGETRPTIRLVGGSHPYEGRIDVYIDGEWGTICNDYWDLTDARVACRQLGFGEAISAVTATQRHFNKGSGKIWLDDMECTGTEITLQSCSHRDVGSHDCNHSEDVGVICGSTSVTGTDLLLVGGNSPTEGRIVLFVDNKWGTVCTDFWDLKDANVTCRQLGFGSAVTATVDFRYGPGRGPILLDDVTCTGRESSLLDCQHTGIGNHNCPEHKNAGVDCEPK